MTLRSIAKDVLPSVVRRSLRRVLQAGGVIEAPAPKARGGTAAPSQPIGVTEYWTQHNVTLHQQFPSPEASLDSFDWRSRQYFGYLELWP